jgi:hypothetical protein
MSNEFMSSYQTDFQNLWKGLVYKITNCRLCTDIGTDSNAVLRTAKFRITPSVGQVTITDRNYTFHGQMFLPPDRYEWILEDPFILEELASPLKSRDLIRIGQSHSWIKMLTSVAHLILSCITIYRSQGSQIDQYGYAAFGLSVFPYAVMSFINLLFVGILGEYSRLYVMRTAILDEAKQCGGSISGEVGVLGEMTVDENERFSGRECVAMWLQTEENEQGKFLAVRRDDDQATARRFKLVSCDDPADFVFRVESVTNQKDELPYDDGGGPCTEDQARAAHLFLISWIVSPLIVFVIPYVFIFLLTRFHKRDSSLAERAWTISWLVANQLTFVVLFLWSLAFPQHSWDWDPEVISYHIFVLLMSIPAIGGFVTVGKMAFSFGSCS